MNAEQYFEAYRKAKDDSRRKLKEKICALDVAWRLINDSPPPKCSLNSYGKHSTSKGLSNRIDELLPSMLDNFTTANVCDALVAKHGEDVFTSRSRVNKELMHISARDNPPILVIALGRGSGPTKFTKNIPTPAP